MPLFSRIRNRACMVAQIRIKTALKWLVLTAAYVYMAYLLITFDQYPEMWQQLRSLSLFNYIWLLLVLILLPVNMVIEAVKWRDIVSKSEEISLKTSLHAILGGFSTGFFTPNRLGEMVGRIAFMKKENHKAGITYNIINGFSTNFVIVLCGIPASVLFFLSIKHENVFEGKQSQFYILMILGMIASLALYLAVPRLVRNIKAPKVQEFACGWAKYTRKDSLNILFLAFFRYMIFCIQFFATLRFFDVEIEFWQSLLAIPAYYLFVTFTPSLAFSEAAVRSTYTVLFIGAFSKQLVSIALAGTVLWLINFGLPTLVGTHLLSKRKKLNKAQ